MIYLIDALMREKHGFVIGAEEHGCKGAFSLGDGPTLHGETSRYAGFDLGGAEGGARGEEIGGYGLRGGGCEGCFVGHFGSEIWLVGRRLG